jgi:transposase InsO family protein
MACNGWRSIIVKKYRPATNHELVYDRFNLLNQDFTTSAPNQKWLTDMTYVYTLKDGWTYLASVMDLWSRKIIGYAYGTQMDANLVTTALGNAALNRRVKGKNIIVHTDLGSQFTGVEFETALTQMGMTHSYSRKGTPYDNAGIESFHATIKKEEIYVSTYQTAKQARIKLFQYIEGWYNRKRIHEAIQYMTPVEFEQKYNPN